MDGVGEGEVAGIRVEREGVEMLSQKFGHASYSPIISLLFFIFQS